MKIPKVSAESKDKIKRKSAWSLPNNPTEAGYKAQNIRDAFYKPIVDMSNSVLTEIDRVIDELNEALDIAVDKIQSVTEGVYTGAEFTYSKSGDNFIITGYIGIKTRVTFPIEVIYEGKRYPVTTINALGVTPLKEVTIPYETTTIGSNAFKDSTLDSVRLARNYILPTGAFKLSSTTKYHVPMEVLAAYQTSLVPYVSSVAQIIGYDTVKYNKDRIDALFTKISTDISAHNTTIGSHAGDHAVTLQNAKEYTDVVKDRVETIITTPVEGVSAQEILDARAGEVSLGAKVVKIDTQLDDLDTEVSAIPNQTYITEKAKTVDVDNAIVLKADKTITDNLQTVKADKSYVDTLAQSIASGSPKGTYPTLVDLETALPTGNTNIYVVLANGNWYFWNESAWISGGVYQSTSIADKSVTPVKTSFVERVTTNLILLNDVAESTTNGITYSVENGELFIVGTATEYADITLDLKDTIAPGTYYFNPFKSGTYAGPHYPYFYNGSANVGTLSFSAARSVTVTAEANKIQLYIENAESFTDYSATFQLSTILQTTYTPYNTYEIADNIKNKDNTIKTEMILNSAITEEKISDNSIIENKIKDKAVTLDKLSEDIITHDDNTNFIKHDYIVTGKYVYKDGFLRVSENVNATNFIKLEEGQQYYFDKVHNTYYAFYDTINNLVASYETLGNLTSPFTVPTGAVYGRFTIIDSAYSAKTYWISKTNSRPSDYGYRLLHNSLILDNSIANSKLQDNAVTISKIDFKRHDDDTNFISGWVDNKYINGNGEEIDYSGFYASTPIYLSAGNSYYWSNLYGGYCAFYALDGTVIQGYGMNDPFPNPFTVPTGATYMRVTAVNETQKNGAWISKINRQPDSFGYELDIERLPVKVPPYIKKVNNPCDYLGDEICAFTKCLCIGDSLTSGTTNHRDSGVTEYISYDKYSFPRNLERLTNLEVTNMGFGGKTSAEWYADKALADLSGYDLAIIQLGVNDQMRYSEFGETSQTGFTDIITKLKTDNKNIKIFVANIIPALSYASEGYLTFSADLLSWLNTTYANDKDVIPLDIQQYGHTKDIDAYNCGHLSAYGYYRLAKDYKAFISYYMLKYPSVFKEIQFVGTDYWYDNPNA